MMDDELRNGLWQACNEFYFRVHDRTYDYDVEFQNIIGRTYVDFFKKPSDTIPYGHAPGIRAIRDWFFNAKWWEVYNFLEFVISTFDSPPFAERVSFFLEREKSGYRILQDQFVAITDKVELSTVSDAANLSSKFSGAREHIRSAIALFSKKPQPDYRNSIKESISAVESTARVVTGNPKATLGDALKAMSSTIALHSALREGMNKLYGYTSDEGGFVTRCLRKATLTKRKRSS
jgi:AbiJ N-terminal domain 4